MTAKWDVDACRAVCGLLRSWGHDAHMRRLDEFTGEEGVVVQELPSLTVSEEFDGSRIDDLLIHVTVRSRSEAEAREKCRSIESMIDRTPVRSANGSYRWIATDIYTHSQELPLEEAGFYAWDLRLKVQAEIERN